MREIEAEMKTRVRKDGKDADRTTGNMVWAEFIHTTSRPVDGIPDPQLHAHVFVFNTTWDDEESRWKAGQFRELKARCPVFPGGVPRAAGGQAAGSGLRRRAQTRRFRDRGDAEGCAETLLAATALIEKVAEEKGITDPEPQGGTRGRNPREERNRLELGTSCARNGTPADRQGAAVLAAVHRREHACRRPERGEERRSIMPSTIASSVRRWCRNAS